MGDRKQPRPVPTNQVRPDPPPAPPRKVDQVIEHHVISDCGRSAAAALRAVFTNDVIRAIGALAREQNVCREQGGQVVFVTGMEAAREYIVEHVTQALTDIRTESKGEPI